DRPDPPAPRALVTKSETRNPKSETQTPNRRSIFLFRISDFGFRICLPLVLAASAAAAPPLASQPAPPKSEEILQAEEAFRKGQFDEALAKLREAVKKNPALPPARLTLAELFLAANQGPNARHNLEAALTEASDDPRCYLFNGSVALREG